MSLRSIGFLWVARWEDLRRVISAWALTPPTRRKVTSMSDLVTRDGADTESYAARATRTSRIAPSTSPRALMDDALILEAPAPDETERPASLPIITPEIVKENLRRVRDSAANTLVTVHSDGKRSYKHDVVVRKGDGRISTVRDGGQRTDRGEGTTDSEKLLREEGQVRVDGLLPKQPRDESGRFRKGSREAL